MRRFMFLNKKKPRVTAVDGKYMIGVYTLRSIAEGEEITFDYNSVTEVSTFLVRLSFFLEHAVELFLVPLYLYTHSIKKE